MNNPPTHGPVKTQHIPDSLEKRSLIRLLNISEDAGYRTGTKIMLRKMQLLLTQVNVLLLLKIW